MNWRPLCNNNLERKNGRKEMRDQACTQGQREDGGREGGRL